MEENKFTKGKWIAEKVIDPVMIGGHPHKAWPVVTEWDDADGEGIGVALCILPHVDVTKETLAYVSANAQLISAAPELLSALQSLLRFSKGEVPEKYHSEYAKVWEPAEEAIKKATE